MIAAFFRLIFFIFIFLFPLGFGGPGSERVKQYGVYDLSFSPEVFFTLILCICRFLFVREFPYPVTPNCIQLDDLRLPVDSQNFYK